MLGAAALELAAFVRPDLELGRHLEWFDSMAERVDGSDHMAMRRLIGIVEGFGGNVDDYYDPDNSFIDRVIERRRGIPISLSIIWIEVGRRAGLDVEGIGLPGHFLVRVGDQLVDPFHYGEAIGSEEAAALVAGAVGGPPRVDPAWLEPVTTVEILARMLRNLAAIYRTRGLISELEWVAACTASVEAARRSRDATP